MGDALCTSMGILDIAAGIIILIALNFNIFSFIFGGIMIGKGIMSLF